MDVVRILIVNNLYPPVVAGGYEVECAGVVQHLRARHDVRVITSVRARDRCAPEHGVVRGLPWLTADERGALRAPAASIAAARLMRRECASFSPDLAFVWNGANVPHSGLRVLDTLGIPVAWRVCEHWFTRLYRGDQFMRHLTPGERGARGVWARGARLLNRLHPELRLDPHRVEPGAVCWNSRALREHSPAPPAVRVIHEEFVFPATPQVDQYADLERGPGPEPLILVVGRLEPHKGPDVAVRALAQLAQRWGISARLTIVGADDGATAAELRRLAAALGVAERLELAGRLEPDRVRELVRRAHVWLVPSTWVEPAPLVCTEAALACVPIVASAIGGIPEMVPGGAEGLLFPPGDDAACAEMLARALTDPAGTQARVQAARRHAADRRHPRYLERIDAFIERTAAAWPCGTSADVLRPVIRVEH